MILDVVFYIDSLRESISTLVAVLGGGLDEGSTSNMKNYGFASLYSGTSINCIRIMAFNSSRLSMN